MLSIIVPRYAMSKQVATLWDVNRAQLEQVASVPYELIVVDNGSKEPAVVHPDVQWTENKGVAPAWNEGRRRAQGDVLVFMTTTVTPQTGWDWRLQTVAQSGRYIAMPYTNGEKPYNGLGITGWCWAIRRDLADEVGPFDETFVPAQFEDTDFYHRAIYDHGVELVNVVGADVFRRASQQSFAGAPWAARKNWLHLANRFRYGWKHGVDPNDIPPFWKTPLRDVEIAH
jgi:glycosyltransferase involved in cell wall biosynthesis